MSLQKKAWKQELNKSCNDNLPMNNDFRNESFFWQLHHSDPSDWKKHTEIHQNTELNYQGKVFYKNIPGYAVNVFKTELIYQDVESL